MNNKKNQVILLTVLMTCLITAWQPQFCEARQKSNRSSKKYTQTKEKYSGLNSKIWGVGLIIGDPTGVTAKWWQNEKVAYEFAIGSQLAQAGVGVHADYLYHMYLFDDTPEAPLYVGGGVFLGGSSDTVSLGGRGVAGMTYIFKEPFDIFMQLAPNFSLLPEVGFFVTFSIGVRIYL